MLYILPGCLSGKDLPGNAGDTGLIPKSGRSPGEGNGNPLQYFLPRKRQGQRSLRTTAHGVTKGSNMT